ncbi:hypothetical protein P5V15_006438 [Pogonomyrmex californicus]
MFVTEMGDSKNFTVENGIYKGRVTNLDNYKSFGELIWINIRKHGDKIARLNACTEETITHADLQNKAIKCALWLQKQGIKSADIICVCTGIDNLESIVPCLSAVYITAIINAWLENTNLETAEYFLELMMPKAIFCSEKSVNVILSAIKKTKCNPTVVVFGNHPDAISFSNILKECSDEEVINFHYIEPDDTKKTACIAFTSGTTGMPKGVEVSNYSMLLILQENIVNMTNLRLLWFSPLYWMSGLLLNLYAIIDGATAILYPEFDEEMTCRLIEKYKIELVYLPTIMINQFLREDYITKYSLSSLSVLLCGGMALRPKMQEKLRRNLPHAQILQGYGTTELISLATFQQPHHKNGSCGTVCSNVQMKIVDIESGKILGPNQAGEIWAKFASMMTGYYKSPEMKSVIDEDGWLHTGDYGYVDEDGELFIINRIKDVIKYRGLDIRPGEIENVLSSHPAVQEVAVIGVPHTLDGEHPLAFIIKRPGAMVTEQELIDFVAKDMMDHYKLRAGVIFLDSFPRTSTNKIIKKDLKAMVTK